MWAWRGSGFVEYLFPYAYPKAQIAERLEQYRLKQVLHNLRAGDWSAGERGIACDPTRVGFSVERHPVRAHLLLR